MEPDETNETSYDVTILIAKETKRAHSNTLGLNCLVDYMNHG
jgi:hypothetical protein